MWNSEIFKYLFKDFSHKTIMIMTAQVCESVPVSPNWDVRAGSQEGFIVQGQGKEVGGTSSKHPRPSGRVSAKHF